MHINPTAQEYKIVTQDSLDNLQMTLDSLEKAVNSWTRTGGWVVSGNPIVLSFDIESGDIVYGQAIVLNYKNKESEEQNGNA